MSLDFYDAALALWQAAEGVGLSEADGQEHMMRYLARNPGLSSVALAEDVLVGAILCGHDGRRGYIHHLAVAQSHRRQGIGKALVEHSLNALKQAGIQKCHLFVFNHNQAAITFWQQIGWTKRSELSLMSSYTEK